MNFKLYKCVHEFYYDVHDVLTEREAENMLVLGILLRGVKDKEPRGWRDPAGWVMATVCDGVAIQLVALMTPPLNLLLCGVDEHVDESVLKCLKHGLAANGITYPGLTAQKTLAEAFAAGCAYEVETNLRLFELTRVCPEIPQIGTMRLCTEADMPFLPYWIGEFRTVAGQDGTVLADIAEYRAFVEGGNLHILEDEGMPVSMAMINRKIASVAGIGLVYTPPYFRGRGYASSLVARLSQLCLDEGFAVCTLYTDLSNPTSNKIYQNIGYEFVRDDLALKFIEEETL